MTSFPSIAARLICVSNLSVATLRAASLTFMLATFLRRTPNSDSDRPPLVVRYVWRIDSTCNIPPPPACCLQVVPVLYMSNERARAGVVQPYIYPFKAMRRATVSISAVRVTQAVGADLSLFCSFLISPSPIAAAVAARTIGAFDPASALSTSLKCTVQLSRRLALFL